MKQFDASTSIINGSLWLYLDNKLIANDGQASVVIEESEKHVVNWYAEGVPGSSYTVTISAPRNAEFQLTKRLGVSGKDFGGFMF